jgi:hypothetical protein
MCLCQGARLPVSRAPGTYNYENCNHRNAFCPAIRPRVTSNFPEIIWSTELKTEMLHLLTCEDSDGKVTQRFIHITCKGSGPDGKEYLAMMRSASKPFVRIEFKALKNSDRAAPNSSAKRWDKFPSYFSAPGNTPGSGAFFCLFSSGCGSGLRGSIWSRIAAL